MITEERNKSIDGLELTTGDNLKLPETLKAEDCVLNDREKLVRAPDGQLSTWSL
jgi:hypothetical protein